MLRRGWDCGHETTQKPFWPCMSAPPSSLPDDLCKIDCRRKRGSFVTARWRASPLLADRPATLHIQLCVLSNQSAAGLLFLLFLFLFGGFNKNKNTMCKTSITCAPLCHEKLPWNRLAFPIQVCDLFGIFQEQLGVLSKAKYQWPWIA